MSSWFLIINNATGDVVSEGSESPPGIDTQVYEVRDVGTRPDWTVKSWNPATKSLFDRPVPISIDRLDDIQARFLADVDFNAVWTSLNAARKTQLRTGIMRVLSQLIGNRRFRQENEVVELD
jgi:hypothetical protein